MVFGSILGSEYYGYGMAPLLQAIIAIAHRLHEAMSGAGRWLVCFANYNLRTLTTRSLHDATQYAAARSHGIRLV